MKILLTGALGNLGTHIMCADNSIIGVSRDNWDNLDEIMSQTDIVIHAAYDLKSNVSIYPEKYFESNLLSTMRILESMRNNNVKRFYFISSCSVYGNSSNMVEKSTCSPVTINGLIKHLNEVSIDIFCSNNSIRYTFLRIFNMYAGNDKFSVLYKLSRAAFNNEPFTLNNNGISQRDFIHVNDVASIILKLVDVDPHENKINIGSGNATKIYDLFNSVKQNHPSLITLNTNKYEVEYARADITLLNKYVSHEFYDVLSYARAI